MVQPLWRTVSYKLNTELTYDTTIPFLSAFLKEKKTCMSTQRLSENAQNSTCNIKSHIRASSSCSAHHGCYLFVCFVLCRIGKYKNWVLAQALFLLFILKQDLTKLLRPSLNFLCTPDRLWTCDPPALAFSLAGITDLCHQAQLWWWLLILHCWGEVTVPHVPSLWSPGYREL